LLAIRLVGTGLVLALGTVSALAGAESLPDHCIVGESVFGCRSERDIEQIIAAHDDVTALRETLAADISSGTCQMFADGERVFLTQKSAAADRSAVRRPGASDEFWIASSWSRPAIDCGRGSALPPPTGVPGSALASAPPDTPKTPRSTACVIKAVMSDAEIAACRRSRE